MPGGSRLLVRLDRQRKPRTGAMYSSYGRACGPWSLCSSQEGTFFWTLQISRAARLFFLALTSSKLARHDVDSVSGESTVRHLALSIMRTKHHARSQVKDRVDQLSHFKLEINTHRSIIAQHIQRFKTLQGRACRFSTSGVLPCAAVRSEPYLASCCRPKAARGSAMGEGGEGCSLGEDRRGPDDFHALLATAPYWLRSRYTTRTALDTKLFMSAWPLLSFRIHAA